MKARAAALSLTIVLFAAGCPTELTKWLTARGMLAAAVPSPEWQPGGVVMWTNGKDGQVIASTVCRRETMFEEAPTCFPSPAQKSEDISRWSAEFTASALKAIDASASTNGIKSAKISFSNVMECNYPLDKFKSDIIKQKCGEGAKIAIEDFLKTKDKSRSFVTWLSSSTKADITIRIESKTTSDVKAEVDAKEVAAAISALSAGAGEALPKVNLKATRINENTVEIVGTELFWGFRGADYTLQKLGY